MFECPEGVSETAETCLDLITDADDVFLTKHAVYFLVEVFRRDNLASTTEHVLGDECSIILSDDSP